ncbi:MAG: flagellar motor switch phosphatase FliY, partial [Clostridiales bacterium]|nr:flagellar motor switch phosphatase FliY [Clostridiales bacterium]
TEEAGAEETSPPADLEGFLNTEADEASAKANDGAEETAAQAPGEAPKRHATFEELDKAHNVNDYLTPEEVDLLGEIGNMCMGAVATIMYTLLDHRVTITTPRVNVYSTYEVLQAYQTPFVIVDVRYVEGIEGKNILLLKENDAMLITDLLMGGDGNVEEGMELNEMHMSAISEIMNQMIGASATSLSNILDRPVNISPPVSEWIDINSDVSDRLDASELVVKISFDMEIEGLLKSQLLQLMPYQLGKDMAQKIMEVQRKDTAAVDASKPQPQAVPPAAPSAPPPPSYAQPTAAMPQRLVDVSPANYPAFDAGASGDPLSGKSMDIVADIPLQVSVELGKTKKTISDILEFGVGTIVVLDKIAGDHVEVLANGKLIAAGEVVVIDENYGVRITDIFE